MGKEINKEKLELRKRKNEKKIKTEFELVAS